MAVVIFDKTMLQNLSKKITEEIIMWLTHPMQDDDRQFWRELLHVTGVGVAGSQPY